MKKASVLAFVLLMLLISCGATCSKECSRLKETFSAHVSVGTTEEILLKFYRDQNWAPSFNRFENIYLLRIPISNQDQHVVMIEVRMTQDKTVKSFKIFDAYTRI